MIILSKNIIDVCTFKVEYLVIFNYAKFKTFTEFISMASRTQLSLTNKILNSQVFVIIYG